MPVEILNTGDVAALWFQDDTRVLYVAHSHFVFLYYIHEVITARSEPDLILRVNAEAIITSLLVLEEGRFIFVATNNGSGVCFDMSDSAPKQGVGSSLASQAESSLSVASPWSEIIRGSNQSIKKWLKAQNIAFSENARRVDLIHTVIESRNIDGRSAGIKTRHIYFYSIF